MRNFPPTSRGPARSTAHHSTALLLPVKGALAIASGVGVLVFMQLVLLLTL